MISFTTMSGQSSIPPANNPKSRKGSTPKSGGVRKANRSYQLFTRQFWLLSVLSYFLSSDTAIQDQAIDCIADLIKCHDSDTRYDEPSCRARVASLYLPLLGIVIENFSLLHGAPIDDNSGLLSLSVATAIATSSLTSRWVPNNDDMMKDYSSQVRFALL